MARLQLLFRGSAPEPYRITFVRIGDHLSVHCTCPAGKAGRYCGHRAAILLGTAPGVFDDDAGAATTLRDWLAGTDVDDALFELTLATYQAEAAKKRISDARKGLAAAMRDVSARAPS
jgi:hypothetical protein